MPVEGIEALGVEVPGLNPAERVRAKLETRIDYKNDVVLVEDCVNSGHVALAERVIKNSIDQCRIDPETGSEVSIDGDVRCSTGALLIARVPNCGRACIFCSSRSSQ